MSGIQVRHPCVDCGENTLGAFTVIDQRPWWTCLTCGFSRRTG